MRTKIGVGLLMLAMAAFPLAETKAQQAPDNGVTQGELAIMLVNLLGWSANMAEAPTPLSSIRLLAANGIAPLNGWQPGELVVLADLAVVLVQSLNLEDQVANPDSPESYVELLESVGVSFQNVGAALVNVEVRGGELVDPGASGETRIPEADAMTLRSQRPVTLPEVVAVVDSLPAVPPRPPRPTPD